MKNLSLHLQGTFQIECNGRILDGFATSKAQALLIYLALERRHPHRRECLAALFWPEQPDKLARQSLRQALLNVRKVLGDGDWLLVDSRSVQLRPEVEVWSDTETIEHISELCKTHQHRDIAQCLSCLERQAQLLEWYGGEFLAGFPSQDSVKFDEWYILRRERIHQIALNAQIALGNFYERRGKPDVALQHVQAQVKMEPWREEAHQQAMRLYYRMNERSKALAQYQKCANILYTEFGVEPSRETRALAEMIQHEEPLPHLVSPLPQKPALALVGRGKEKSELVEALAEGRRRLITVLGPGGVGKSRLVLEVALAHQGIYQDGIYFVALGEGADVQAAVASALGINTAGQGVSVNDYLRERDILLVLDNFEHLVSSAGCLSPLLANSPRLQIIVTSRERLNLREEWIFVLDGLPYPKPSAAGDRECCDSVKLFTQRICQKHPEFQFSDPNLNTIKAICQMVEGLPLAIELAANAMVDDNGIALLKALQSAYDTRSPSIRNLPERHRSLKVVFEHSWQLLTSAEQNQLACLSVFRGGFDLNMAQAVVDISPSALQNLVDKSLVRVADEGRYSMHAMTRQFAAEKLPLGHAARARHAAYFAHLPVCSTLSASADLLDDLEREIGNLRAAWAWSLGEKRENLAWLLPNLLSVYSLRGPLSEGEHLFREALDALRWDNGNSKLREDISYALARIYLAQERYAEALDLARALSHSAKTLFLEGQLLSAQGKCQEARPILEKALLQVRASDDRSLEMDCLRELGNVANRLVEFESAVMYYQECLTLAQDMEDSRNISAVLNNWASIDWELGNLETAQQRYLDALAIYRDLGNRLGEAKALNNLSNVLADRGELIESLEYSRQALVIHREMGNIRGQSAVLNNLGATFFALKDYDAARSNYEQALNLHQLSGNNQACAEALANLSLVDCVQGRLDMGRRNAESAIELAEATGDRISLSNAYYYLGRIEVAVGRLDEAETALAKALELRQIVPHPARLLEIETEFAYIAYLRGDIELAKKQMAHIHEKMDGLEGANEPERVLSLVELIFSL